MNGICTLANDRVYDQLIALLNSIEVILGAEIPVCVYPFDEEIGRISAAIAQRPNVFIYDNQESIQRWDRFMQEASPTSSNRKKFRLYGAHRRFCAFDGPFEKFVYMDADTLLMNSLDHIFDKLNTYDRVVYDFQFLQPQFVYNINSPKLLEVFDKERIESEIFCTGFFGSRKGLFQQDKRDWLLAQIQAGESEILFTVAGDQPVLNYMFMKSEMSIYNLSHHLPDSEKTGCCVTSTHFEEKDRILYDHNKRLTYLHYIGIPPQVTEAVCAGENLEFPYRDLFLHYRYIHEPEKYPVFTTPPRPYYNSSPPPSLWKRVLRKFQNLRTAFTYTGS